MSVCMFVCMCKYVNVTSFIRTNPFPSGFVSGYCSGVTLSLLGNVYVDVDGRSGAVCCSGQSVCEEAEVVHGWIHYCQLW